MMIQENIYLEIISDLNDIVCSLRFDQNNFLKGIRNIESCINGEKFIRVRKELGVIGGAFAIWDANKKELLLIQDDQNINEEYKFDKFDWYDIKEFIYSYSDFKPNSNYKLVNHVFSSYRGKNSEGMPEFIKNSKNVFLYRKYGAICFYCLVLRLLEFISSNKIKNLNEFIDKCKSDNRITESQLLRITGNITETGDKELVDVLNFNKDILFNNSEGFREQLKKRVFQEDCEDFSWLSNEMFIVQKLFKFSNKNKKQHSRIVPTTRFREILSFYKDFSGREYDFENEFEKIKDIHDSEKFKNFIKEVLCVVKDKNGCILNSNEEFDHELLSKEIDSFDTNYSYCPTPCYLVWMLHNDLRLMHVSIPMQYSSLSSNNKVGYLLLGIEDRKENKAEITNRLKKIRAVFQPVFHPLIDYIFYNKLHNEKTKKLAMISATSQVFSRNMSHNIGSHVLNRATVDNIFKKLVINEDSIDFDKLKWLRYLKNKLDNYILERNEFLSDISDQSLSLKKNVYFYRDLILGFIENFLITDNIAASEGFGFKDLDSPCSLNIIVKIKGNEVKAEYTLPNNIGVKYLYPKESEGKELPYYVNYSTNANKREPEEFFNSRNIIGEDIEISLSGLLGQHAIYSILENFIRNSAKHNNYNEKLSGGLKIYIEIIDTDKDYYDVELYDDVSEINEDNTGFYKALLETLTINFLTDPNAVSSKKHLGIADMAISANILAGKLDFDYFIMDNRILELGVKPINGKKYLLYKFRFQKPKRVIIVGNYNKLESEFNKGLVVKNQTKDLKADEVKGFEFAVIDSNFITEENYINLLNLLPCRVLVFGNESDIVNKLLISKKISRLTKLDCRDINELIEECWNNWISRFTNSNSKIGLFIYFDKSVENWKEEEVKKQSIDKIETKIFSSENKKIEIIEADKKRVFYDNHSKLSGCGKIDIFNKDSYIVFDKNSSDYSSIFFPGKGELKWMQYKMAEAGLLKIFVIDERIAELGLSSTKRGSIPSNSIDHGMENDKVNDNKFWDSCFASGIYVCNRVLVNSNECWSLKEIEDRENDYKSGRIDYSMDFLIKTKNDKIDISITTNLYIEKSNGTQEQYKINLEQIDILILHRTLLQKITDSIGKSKSDVLNELYKRVSFVFLDSGGGTSDISVNSKFLNYSVLRNAFLGNQISKLSLVNQLMQI